MNRAEAIFGDNDLNLRAPGEAGTGPNFIELRGQGSNGPFDVLCTLDSERRRLERIAERVRQERKPVTVTLEPREFDYGRTRKPWVSSEIPWRQAAEAYEAKAAEVGRDADRVATALIRHLIAKRKQLREVLR